VARQRGAGVGRTCGNCASGPVQCSLSTHWCAWRAWHAAPQRSSCGCGGPRSRRRPEQVMQAEPMHSHVMTHSATSHTSPGLPPGSLPFHETAQAGSAGPLHRVFDHWHDLPRRSLCRLRRACARLQPGAGGFGARAEADDHEVVGQVAGHAALQPAQQPRQQLRECRAVACRGARRVRQAPAALDDRGGSGAIAAQRRACAVLGGAVCGSRRPVYKRVCDRGAGARALRRARRAPAVMMTAPLPGVLLSLSAA